MYPWLIKLAIAIGELAVYRAGVIIKEVRKGPQVRAWVESAEEIKDGKRTEARTDRPLPK